MHDIAIYPSPIGNLTLTCNKTHLLALHIGDNSTSGAAKTLGREEDHPVFRQCAHWLNRYFSGEQPKPEELPLKPEGSPFQKQVWQFLLEIPWGETRTYGDLARNFPGKMSAQAVGQAVGRNPVAIIIPCHRVLGAGGRLTGFSAGLEMKRWLLRHEGIVFRE